MLNLSTLGVDKDCTYSDKKLIYVGCFIFRDCFM